MIFVCLSFFMPPPTLPRYTGEEYTMCFSQKMRYHIKCVIIFLPRMAGEGRWGRCNYFTNFSTSFFASPMYELGVSFFKFVLVFSGRSV